MAIGVAVPRKKKKRFKTKDEKGDFRRRFQKKKLLLAYELIYLDDFLCFESIALHFGFCFPLLFCIVICILYYTVVVFIFCCILVLLSHCHFELCHFTLLRLVFVMLLFTLLIDCRAFASHCRSCYCCYVVLDARFHAL